MAQDKEDNKEGTADAISLIENKAKDESAFEFVYAAPGSPVLPLIGVEGDQITRSESLRKWGIGLLTGLGGQQTGPGLAIDFNPYWSFSKRAMSLEDYRSGSNFAGRIAARTKVAAAFSFGDKAASRPSSIVTSLSTSLLDSHDQLFSDTFSSCIAGSAIESAFTEIHIRASNDYRIHGLEPGYSIEGKLAEFREEYEKNNPGVIDTIYADCATRLGKAMASAPSLDVGAGIRQRGSPGQLSHLENSGTILWGTFATGVLGGSDEEQDTSRAGPLAKLRVRGLLHARYTFKEDVLDDKFVLQGRRDMGMIVAGIESAPSLDPKKTETLRWNLQAGWNRQSAVLPTEVDKRFWRYQAIASLRIRDGLWANGSLGRVSGKGVKSDTKALLTLTFTEPGKASQLTDYYNSRDN